MSLILQAINRQRLLIVSILQPLKASPRCEELGRGLSENCERHMLLAHEHALKSLYEADQTSVRQRLEKAETYVYNQGWRGCTPCLNILLTRIYEIKFLLLGGLDGLQ
jgi:hypothetical protein